MRLLLSVRLPVISTAAEADVDVGRRFNYLLVGLLRLWVLAGFITKGLFFVVVSREDHRESDGSWTFTKVGACARYKRK